MALSEVVRIVPRTDRDMEYIHLKDYRGSGTEPVNVLSSYKFQDGLAYYKSTKDTASHFFIDYLPKGNYVFEYSTRIVHKGRASLCTICGDCAQPRSSVKKTRGPLSVRTFFWSCFITPRAQSAPASVL